jgi:hypothetical protein
MFNFTVHATCNNNSTMLVSVPDSENTKIKRISPKVILEMWTSIFSTKIWQKALKGLYKLE